jgi:hypothetical protein
MTKGVKMPMQHLMNTTLDYVRKHGTCTQAVVILIDDPVSDAKIGALHGDLGSTIRAVEKVLAALHKARARKSGIIVPN